MRNHRPLLSASTVLAVNLTISSFGCEDDTVVGPPPSARLLIVPTDAVLPPGSTVLLTPIAISVTLRPYDDFEAAVQIVNDSAYGLQAGVFTHDIRRIHHAYTTLEVGGLIVNDYPTLRIDNFPYGGVKDSGLGREGVRYSLQEMTEMRALVLDLRH